MHILGPCLDCGLNAAPTFQTKQFNMKLVHAVFLAMFLVSCAVSALAQATEFAKWIERDLAAGQTHRHDLTLSAGQVLKAEIQVKGIEASIKMFDAENRLLTAMRTDGNLAERRYIAFLVAADGRYRIEIHAADQPGQSALAGSYRMLVMQPQPATDADRKHALAQALANEAETLFEKNTAESLRQSIAKFQESLAIWRALGNQRHEAEMLGSIATTRKMLGENRQALPIQQESLALAQKIGDKQLEAALLNGLGTIHSALGEYLQAIQCWQQTLQLCREFVDRRSEASALSNLGTASASLGKPQEALDYYQQALRITREIGHRRSEARLLINIGMRYLSTGDPNKATESFQQALTLSREMGLRNDEAAVLHNLAGAWLELGDYQKVLDYDNQALTIARTIGYRRIEVAALLLIGRTHTRLGDQAPAVTAFKQALTLSRESGNRNEEANALASLGLIHRLRGEFPQAIETLEQAAKLHRAIGARTILASDLMALGDARLSMGEIDKAVEYLREALALSRETSSIGYEATTSLLLGKVQWKQGHPEQALELFRRGLELSRAIGYVHLEIESLRQLAQFVLEQQNYSEAQTHIESAIRLLESARASVGRQDLRSTFRARVHNYYEAWIEALMGRSRQERDAKQAAAFAARAFEVSEQSRARGLIELLQEARVEIREGIAPELLQREAELYRQLTVKSERLTRVQPADLEKEPAVALRDEISKLLAEYSDAQARIRLANPRYAALNASEPLNLTEIQRQTLDEKSLLLEYSLGEERSYLFAVTSQSLQIFVLPKRAEVEQVVRRLNQQLRARADRPRFEMEPDRRQRIAHADAEYKAVAAELSRMLLEPARELLADKRLLIVADGALHYVPFAALPAPKPASHRSTVAAMPLIVEHEITLIPSASAIALEREQLGKRAPATKLLAAFGDPVFSANDPRVQPVSKSELAKTNSTEVERKTADAVESNWALPRLPSSRREVETIVELAANLTKSGNRLWLGFEAERAAVIGGELSQYRFLHFATHGVLDDAQANLSGLVFSLVDRHGVQQNGFFRLVDVYKLRLFADLVVLSGCRTGLGQELNGEGLIGLTRGFLLAGASRVMASLWEVSDQATAELMQRFYRELLVGKRTPAAALRAAQISFLKDSRWQSPFYWGAFVIHGEPR